jgi:hypothetical protein
MKSIVEVHMMFSITPHRHSFVDDEEFCEQLELNECNKYEYRYHYDRQRIPLMFLDDGRYALTFSTK